MTTWDTPERIAALREMRANGDSLETIRNRLDAMPGLPVCGLRRLRAYCKKHDIRSSLVWTNPQDGSPPQIKRMSSGLMRYTAERAAWATPARIATLKKERAKGTEMPAIHAILSAMPGPPMVKRGSLQTYCQRFDIYTPSHAKRRDAQEKGRVKQKDDEEAGWQDPTIPQRPPPARRKCLKCGIPFAPAHFGQWLHVNCKIVASDYDDTEHGIGVLW